MITTSANPTPSEWVDSRTFSDLNWPQAAYLHIPFCRQRCHYCDFATGLGTSELIETYVQALCTEIDCIPTGGQTLTTVFFGGGTPSLLNGGQLTRILQGLQTRIPLAVDCEISLEANPGTTCLDTLKAYQEAGVNRISLGVQAFQPELLKLCGRLHGVEEVYETLDHLRQVGLTNVNLDLIFGLPHQTLEDWEASLQALLQIRPPHVSVYDLTIEAETRFGRLYQPGSSPLPSEDTTVTMYRMARQTLMAAGYEHYEISNFALPGFQCRHNRVYWENRSYYGLGMGATGYLHGRRIEQPRRLHDYFQNIQNRIQPTAPITPLQDRWVDTLMLGLRLREGIALSTLAEQFSPDRIRKLLDQLAPFADRGWVSWQEDRLRLIPPEGWLFANTVLVAIMDF